MQVIFHTLNLYKEDRFVASSEKFIIKQSNEIED